MRDRGYFEATVEPLEQLDAGGTRATVTYRVNPGHKSLVSSFQIEIPGFDPRHTEQPHSQANARLRATLAEDVTRIRDAIIAQGHLSPVLEDPRIQRDSERNTIAVILKGVKGPKATVVVRLRTQRKDATRATACQA